MLQAHAPIKLATNSDLYRRMEEDMDHNCGDVLEGRQHRGEGPGDLPDGARCGLRTRSKSELLGYGRNEFVPWQLGAVM